MTLPVACAFCAADDAPMLATTIEGTLALPRWFCVACRRDWAVTSADIVDSDSMLPALRCADTHDVEAG